MNTLLIKPHTLFNNFFDDWDRAFFDGDHSYWRRNLSTGVNADSSIRHHDAGDHREVYVPLPGFKKEHIKGEINDGVVHISAERDENSAEYSFVLPDDVDLSTISTKHEDGLLTVKVEKEAKSKNIEIKID